MPRTWAAFILTNRRPNNVVTYDSLIAAGWTHPIYLIVDNEDPTVSEYRKKYGNERVVIFDKQAIAATIDEADTQNDRRTIVYARNANWTIAKELGVTHFIQLDDDYTVFMHRFVEDEVIKSKQITRMNDVVDTLADFLEVSNARSVAFSQGGDHMGGVAGPIRRGIKRKAMNSFILRTDQPFDFVGRINEDVNTYVVEGTRGRLFFTIMGVQLNQVQTQQSEGGMTDSYRQSGTYVKSFYSVMFAPSCVKIGTMGRTDRRFHHSIDWEHATPKIISGKHRKHND